MTEVKQKKQIKRHHNKSRTGCSTCKQRRVKCDENKPACNNCRHKELRCVYEPEKSKAEDTGRRAPSCATRAPALLSKPQAPKPPLETYISPDPSSPFEDQTSGRTHSSPALSIAANEDPDDEFHLAQTYLEHVAASFSDSCTFAGQTWIWQVFVPAQAFVSPTVRHGIMAAAALYLHLRSRKSGEVTDATLIETATAHGNAFVERSRAELDALRPANTSANVASSRLLFILALAFYRHRRADGSDAEVITWTWLHLLRGVTVVHEALMATGQAMHPNIVQDMMSEKHTALSTDSDNLEPSIALTPQTDHENVFLYLSRTRHARIATLRFAHSQGWLGFDGADGKAFASVIDQLDDIAQRINAGRYTSLFRVIISWAASLPAEVVQLLIDRHPGALAIYTHWLMLLTLVEDLWWVGDMGRVCIRAVLKILDDPENALPVLSWPKEILNLRDSVPTSPRAETQITCYETRPHQQAT